MTHPFRIVSSSTIDRVRRAAIVVGLLHLASVAIGCSSPTVIATERPSGSGGTSGVAPVAAGGSPGNGVAGQGGASTGISIPDAGAGTTGDVPPPQPTSCAEEGHKAEAVPLDVMLLVDSSGSMDDKVDTGTATKWGLAQRALVGFVRDPRSAGLGVGLQFFPLQKPCTADAECGGAIPRCGSRARCVDAAGVLGLACSFPPIGLGNCRTGGTCVETGTCETTFEECGNVGQPCAMNGGMCLPRPKACAFSSNECDVVNYETATVAFSALPGNEMPLVQALRGKAPYGGTPMRPALEGVLKQMRAHLEKNPGHKGVVILATDGVPSCGAINERGLPPVATVAGMAQQGTPSISTYVIGVFAASEIATVQPQLDLVAMAGGTGQAFVISANDDLTKKLQEALDAIRGAALSCEFTIPPPKTGAIDHSKVNVRYTGSGGTAQDLAYVKTMAACDPARGGWYYDVDPATGKPSRILVCPSTCQQFKKDGSAKVDLLFGCATKTID